MSITEHANTDGKYNKSLMAGRNAKYFTTSKTTLIEWLRLLHSFNVYIDQISLNIGYYT